MARKPRIHFPGAVYHVIVRGNSRQEIFLEKGDFSRFKSLMQEGIDRFGHQIHAFCLMPNHAHLVLQVDEVPLSRIMQSLSLRYTTWINRKHNRTGHLFQGRYKAIPVGLESHLLELVRYIHLNPIRSGLSPAAREYQWSSHRAYLGEEYLPWLTTSTVLSRFSPKTPEARQGYLDFVNEGVSEGHRDDFQCGAADGEVLNDEIFMDGLHRQPGEKCRQPATLEAIIDRVCVFYGISEKHLASSGRQRRLAEARALSQIGWHSA